MPPTGYTATSMSGSGWTCSVATTTCTRSDALAAGASYPPIILVGNIASNASSPLVNVAVVLGGGDTTPDNNSDSDTTVLGGVPAAITVPTLGHFGLLLMGLVMLLAGLAARRVRGAAG